MSPTAKTWTRLVTTLALFLACWLNWRYPVFRFTSPALDQAFFVAFMFLLAAAAVFAIAVRPSWVGWPMAAVLAVPAAGASLLALLALPGVAETFASGRNTAFEPIHLIRTSRGDVRAYRTNGGATTSFGIVVRQERVLFPGLKVVRDIYHAYPAYDVPIEMLPDGQVMVDGARMELRSAVWF